MESQAVTDLLLAITGTALQLAVRLLVSLEALIRTTTLRYKFSLLHSAQQTDSKAVDPKAIYKQSIQWNLQF